MKRAYISGTGFSVPDEKLTNDDIAKLVDTNDEWIQKRTGIIERKIAPKDKVTSYYATEASRMAIKNAGIEPNDIELIICATSTPDMIFPATACKIQQDLEIDHCGGFDLQAACSGFTYGMTVGQQFI
ncbi:MAG: hypothetical protein KAS39_00745 [Actinomycetia bacterium]|nr:hypothetical protein [Actinomycetes bacterium]